MPYPVKRKAPKQTPRTYKDKTVRRCTISHIIRDLESSAYYSRLSKYRYIRLSGKWLERAGFQIGECIDISVTKNMLVIQPAKAHG